MSAMSVQSQSATDLDGLKRKVDGLALLRVYEFCEGREISACESLTSSLRINALITSLVETADRTTAASVPPSRGTTASAPQSGSKSGVGGVRNPLAVALGIVFGALAVIGIVVGVLVWKRRVKRLKTEMVVRG
ncbi:hypothetical protein K469DRAFT_716642 [Zopfia rhizophila CBS 207.26]|uniref:Uncharacterized protein n=1 Tax=Zopfia rhizophila CBS 207.26 TaxID=1314779 RepID=A0A6A6EJ49_9PEZI|nr:hypothetical protein K469DRAFT_716642 [Zopfia rhizophila CBS 207.26]